MARNFDAGQFQPEAASVRCVPGCNQHIGAFWIVPAPFCSVDTTSLRSLFVFQRLQELEQRGGHLFGLLFVWQMA